MCKLWLSVFGGLIPAWHLLSHIVSTVFCFWGPPEVDLLASSYTNQCQHYYTLENPSPTVALGLYTFNQPWKFQVNCVFFCTSSSSSVQVLEEQLNIQSRLPILGVMCWMEAPWLPTVLIFWEMQTWFLFLSLSGVARATEISTTKVSQQCLKEWAG